MISTLQKEERWRKERRKSFDFGNVGNNWAVKHKILWKNQRRYVIVSIATAFPNPTRYTRKGMYMWFNFKLLLSLGCWLSVGACISPSNDNTAQFVWFLLLFSPFWQLLFYSFYLKKNTTNKTKQNRTKNTRAQIWYQMPSKKKVTREKVNRME